MTDENLTGVELAQMAIALKKLAAYQALGTVEELAALKERTRWIPVSERMPEVRQRVLAFYKNEFGQKRIELACYIPPRTVKSSDFLSDTAEGCDEYDEENDCYWVIEGWWEDSWESEENWQITSPVTHWMPLPEAPKEADHADG